MNHYNLTSTYEGVVQLAYDEQGRLILLDMRDAVLSDPQVKYFQMHTPLAEGDLLAWAKKSKITADMVVEDLTFDKFYESYPVKEARKKAEQVWKKLPDAERMKAYKYLPTLHRKKAITGQHYPHPTTYLNQQRWND